MNKLFKINDLDNVAVALEDLPKGYCENDITLLDDVPFGHKALLCDIKKGESIIKYGNPIGYVTEDLSTGAYIHEHNLKTNLTNKFEYKFSGDNEYKPVSTNLTFKGYLRADGSAAVRNEIWIIPTVGCVNSTARELEKRAQALICDGIDGIYTFEHPYGCSQMGDDQENTRKILASLIEHPNCAGALVLSLGCENSNAEVIKTYLSDKSSDRIKFLVTQNCEDEISEGLDLIKALCDYAKNFEREDIPLNRLVVGLKCGGSDAFSGITANALLGKITDKLTDAGATVILSETPEMFGAEHILMSRAENETVFNKTVDMINSFKDYFALHNEECYENPSPGNHDGGITTLEEKSLGCIQKGGSAVVTDVFSYGERAKTSGLNLLTGPGNDIVSTTNLSASGAHIILFTTGRGTPLGSVVPTVKVSSNTRLFDKKSKWIDFNAGNILADGNIDDEAEKLLSLIIQTASGKKTRNELNSCRDIAIFKDGVIL